MAGRWYVLSPILLWGLMASSAPAQSKSSPKSSDKNKEAAQALRQEAKAALAEADAASDLERGYEILRRALHRLADSSALPSGERLDLIGRLEDRMSEMRRRMTAMKQKSESSDTAKNSSGDKKLRVSPAFSSSFNGSVTPVASPDGRFVRIGIRGTFSMVTPTGPLVPVQIPVPSFFYGPGKGFTAGRPENVFQMFFPSPRGTIIQINSAASAPDGGL